MGVSRTHLGHGLLGKLLELLDLVRFVGGGQLGLAAAHVHENLWV